MSEWPAAQATVSVRHVGGIENTDVSLSPGVTALVGRNATNRTSFLQALRAVAGSDRASLHGAADTARVELDLGDATYHRTLSRTGDGVAFGGDPLLDDPEPADLYAFLLADNPARRAVARGGDLRDLVVRPIDTRDLQREIDRLEAEKRDLDASLADLDDVAARLADRRERAADLEAERDRLRDDLAAAREALSDAADGTDGTDDDGSLAELNDARSELADVRFQLETERDSLASLREQRTSLRDRLASLPDEDADAGDFDERIADVRERRERVAAELTDLQRVVQFNEDMLDADGAVSEAIADAASAGDRAEVSDGGTVTDALVSDDSEDRTCWTCGSQVPAASIEATLDQLRDLRDRKRAERDDLDADLADLRERRDAVAERREERAAVETELREVEREIEDREQRVADLEARTDDLSARVTALEGEVEREGQAAAVERAKRVQELEGELDRVADDLADARETIDSLEDRLAARERLEAERREVVRDLKECRERVERVEREAVDAFNDEMDAVLDRLGYENIARVWLERRPNAPREDASFDLHVVREDSDGTAYEDTVDHLSESEREVTGLVFALAGYLAHEVHEDVPFLLLDSLEAIDADRIADLVDHVADRAAFVVAALLPEDAQAVAADHRVTDI
jgi:predicted  nucleic acid-binding Zn-ribbon protein